MIGRINPKVEKAMREAMSHVAHVEADQIESALGGLDDAERTEAIALSMAVVCYVMVDVCEMQWPNDASVRRIAEGLASVGSTAERLRLNAEEIYMYLSGSVMKAKPPEEVLEDAAQAGRLPIIVAQRAAVVYRPKDTHWWEYLDQIESAVEAAWALDLSVLPAAVMRAYLPKPATDA
jgi:hypothetical protein